MKRKLWTHALGWPNTYSFYWTFSISLWVIYIFDCDCRWCKYSMCMWSTHLFSLLARVLLLEKLQMKLLLLFLIKLLQVLLCTHIHTQTHTKAEVEDKIEKIHICLSTHLNGIYRLWYQFLFNVLIDITKSFWEHTTNSNWFTCKDPQSRSLLINYTFLLMSALLQLQLCFTCRSCRNCCTL